ncbi:MAG TPA: N(4)-(beta-N-acetylglucosaminyl)-L-asparaginase [Vicinamibacterales bacterium]|nr:N(4)-(beta-N-acetylglucosaminyl)-L-asparaginase [Vicinamibacterales bacterium]
MAKRLNRRDFMATTAAAGLAAAARPLASGPTVIVQNSVRPVVVSSANGHRFKNGGTKTGVEIAFEMMTTGKDGKPVDVLDALIAGVNICELDPLDTSVGYGGLPNADGVVQLDACCMHGPKKKAGGVGAIEGVKTPSLVAKAVMEKTDHHLIVGKDAQTFARNLGFEILPDLNTPESRKQWLEWKMRTDPLHYIRDPLERAAAEDEVRRQMAAEGLLDENHIYGTINCDGVNARGEVCGVTTTSGLAWKIPGRLGDSPILGAGLYVDNNVGAAGSTGRGEANLYNLCSFLIVDEMRRGASPKDAGLTALKRIKENTIEKRLLNTRGLPNFNINFYIVNKQGVHAGVAMYNNEGRGTYAVCDEKGGRLEKLEPLLEGTAT